MEYVVALQQHILSLSPGVRLVAVLAVGFLGGIILNVMPCVLPVLTLKGYDLVEKAGHVEPSVNRRHGMAYGLGVLLFYAPVGLAVGVTKAPANTMFQNPLVTAGLCLLMFALGLNALGVFELAFGVSGDGGGEGLRGSVFKGLLAAIMSIPCSAPMLGIALGVAVAADTSLAETLAIYLMVGLGLAFPFIVLSFMPSLAKRLPKPGAWMDKLKKVMGFTLLGAAVWLFGVLDSQISKEGSDLFLYFSVLFAALLWAQSAFGGLEHSTRRRLVVKAGALLVAGLSGYFVSANFGRRAAAAPAVQAAAQPAQQTESQDPPVVVDDKIAWSSFNPDEVQTNLDRGRPVFMDYTADWCLNCKSNEKAFIETPEIRAKLTETNILPMKADFTNEDETIEKWIKDLGRGGIPIYVIYLPNGKNILLPETISTAMLSKALDEAAKQFPKNAYAPPSKRGERCAPAAKKAEAAARDATAQAG